MEHRNYHSSRLTGNVLKTILCSGVSVSLGLAFLAFTSPVFEAETRIYLKNNQVTDRPADAKDRQFIATQAEIIRSPLIIRKALSVSPISFPDDFEGDQIKLVMEKLTVAPILDTDVLSIGFRSNSADEAVGFVNALVGSFKDQLKNLESTTNSETLELLTNRETEIRNELALLNNQHLELRSQNELVGQPRDAVNVYSGLLNDLAQKLTDARLEKIQLASRLDALEQNDAIQRKQTTVFKPVIKGDTVSLKHSRLGPDEMVVADLLRDENDPSSKHLGDLETQLVAAKIRAQSLGSKFGDRHIEARQAADELAKLEQLFLDQIQVITESLKLRYQRSVKAESDLDQLYKKEQQVVKELDIYLVKDEKLRSDIQRTDLMYKTILDRLGEIRLTDKALESGQSSVVVQDLQGAKIIAEKIWPQPKSFLAICLMVGMCGGFLLTFGVDVLQSQSQPTRPQAEPLQDRSVE